MELFTYGRTPYAGMDNIEVIRKVESGYKLERPPNHNIPDEIYDKMKSCWDVYEERRPTFEHLKNFFLNYGVAVEFQYKDLVE
jgi:hypothetical protein